MKRKELTTEDWIILRLVEAMYKEPKRPDQYAAEAIDHLIFKCGLEMVAKAILNLPTKDEE